MEGPPIGVVSQLQVAEEFGLDGDGLAHSRDDGLADGIVGLGGGAQLEEVVALAEIESGEDALPVGVGCQVLSQGWGRAVQGVESQFRRRYGVVKKVLHSGFPD